MTHYTLEDYRAGTCELRLVGEPKPKPAAPPPVIPPPLDLTPDEVSLEQVVAGFKEAYIELGGGPGLAAWGRTNPTEFYKLLARLSTAKIQGSTNLPQIVFNFGGDLGRILAEKTINQE